MLVELAFTPADRFEIPIRHEQNAHWVTTGVAFYYLSLTHSPVAGSSLSDFCLHLQSP